MDVLQAAFGCSDKWLQLSSRNWLQQTQLHPVTKSLGYLGKMRSYEFSGWCKPYFLFFKYFLRVFILLIVASR
jgi:hypothetical protein